MTTQTAYDCAAGPSVQTSPLPRLLHFPSTPEQEAARSRLKAAAGVALAIFVIGCGVGLTWQLGAGQHDSYGILAAVWSEPVTTKALSVPMERRLPGRSHALGGGASVRQLEAPAARPFADFDPEPVGGSPVAAAGAAQASRWEPLPEPDADPEAAPQAKAAQGFVPPGKLQAMAFKMEGAPGGGATLAVPSTRPDTAPQPPLSPSAGAGAHGSQPLPGVRRPKLSRDFGGMHVEDKAAKDRPAPGGDFASAKAEEPALHGTKAAPLLSNEAHGRPIAQYDGQGPHRVAGDKPYEAWPEGLRDVIQKPTKNGVGINPGCQKDREAGKPIAKGCPQPARNEDLEGGKPGPEDGGGSQENADPKHGR